ncbi:alpha/beta hydrolase [Methylocaldum sp.]|uniref:alpha/beta fold hydrolase n=1 Tax=Methylocaldum sp. TaxID=1969727 RepID=UPI002D6865D8|nr:alpha/beta hydrolase [Methylocaldum sp.]HYE37599.1 alpha/beta hydrolase [Methylocaldum sp.]
MWEASSPHWHHRYAVVNGMRLHWVEAGTGPLVVLLHGFPEFWYAWRHQIPALAKAGFRVIALDLRGYNESEKPVGIRRYRVETLADDVLAIIHALGQERCAVVGHDWGGAIAWYLAMRHPEAVENLIVLNAPHPERFFQELRTLAQLRKSWYVFFFQFPWLPERLFRAGDYARLGHLLRTEPVRRDAFTEADIRCYQEALAQPGALTAALNYYRALFTRNLLQLRRQIRPIHAPTLLIWGEQDRYLGVGLTQGLERWVPDIQIERIPEASHWVQADAPEHVNSLIIGFLRKRPHGMRRG